MVARSKAKKVSRPTSLMEGVIAKELREQGAILPNARNTQYLCVSCAIHTHAVNIRPNADRKKKGALN
jgi:ribosomal protein S26